MSGNNKYTSGDIHIDDLNRRTVSKRLVKKILYFISLLSIAIGGGMLGGIVTYLLLK